jgi:dTDP-4-dehydrorhamnose 3,5-epimerase
METTQYKIKQTDIPGLLEINISLVEDARGWFQEKYQREKLVALGFPKDFLPVQQNVSFNKEVGVTRGIHAEPWNKYISVVHGKVFAALVDLRKGDGFGKKVEIEIDNSKAVFVPKGVGNSFQTIEPYTLYSYLVDAHWAPELASDYQAVNLADSTLAINWPISLGKAIISDKDKNNPPLSEITK